MSLTQWYKDRWVDIGAPKKNGKFQPCGRPSAKGSKRKYPKCVPASKAAKMTKAQRDSAVRRKRAKKEAANASFDVKTKASK